MSQQTTLTEKSAKATSERGAELVNLIICGLQSARLLAMKELNRHLYAGFMQDAEKTGDQYLILKTREQATENQTGYKEAEAEFDQTIRRLIAIKLSLEGKSDDEIEAELSERDRDLAEAKAMIAEVGR
jgi:hypothetical protein